MFIIYCCPFSTLVFDQCLWPQQPLPVTPFLAKVLAAAFPNKIHIDEAKMSPERGRGDTDFQQGKLIVNPSFSGMYLKSTQKNIQKIPQSLDRCWVFWIGMAQQSYQTLESWGWFCCGSPSKHFPLWGLIVYQKGEVLNTCSLVVTPLKNKNIEPKKWRFRRSHSFSKRHFMTEMIPPKTPCPWWCWLSFGPKGLPGFDVTVIPEMVIILNLSSKNSQWTFTIYIHMEICINWKVPLEKQKHISVYI